MSVAAAAAGGGDGNGGGDDDEKKKGMLEITDSSSSTSSVEVTDEEVEFERVDLSNYEAKRRLDFLRITKSLEANLPLKRSLSTNYQGKSKSFGNLAELGTEEAKDLEKKEHPLNKRRRLLMAHEIRDKELSGAASNSNITHASSLPDLPKNEDSDADKDEDDDKKKASDHDEDEDDDDD